VQKIEGPFAMRCRGKPIPRANGALSGKHDRPVGGWLTEDLLSGGAVLLFAMQILIRFPDKETEQLALGKLIPRFYGKSWATGETAAPTPALGFLAEQGIQFFVMGPATGGAPEPLDGDDLVARAAEALMDDYTSDKELTALTALDGDPFHA
jgi:hypothetical protein